MCLLYIDKIVFSTYHFIYTSCKHCGIFTQIHCLGPIQIQSYCFFFPRPSIKCAPVLFCCTERENWTAAIPYLISADLITAPHVTWDSGSSFSAALTYKGLFCAGWGQEAAATLAAQLYTTTASRSSLHSPELSFQPFTRLNVAH